MFTLLDFYADWCGPCKMMDPIFTELKKDYADKIEFKKVDVESDGALASQYQIESIPTFIILKDGKEVDRRRGATSKEVIKQWLDTSIKA
jgi:thioredoxin 1